MIISQEKVVNSLINKDLDWKCGEITQTGVNTYYFEIEGLYFVVASGSGYIARINNQWYYLDYENRTYKWI